jgi:hypothetical protein
MKTLRLTFPEFLFIIGTRAVLGTGVGLLAAGPLRRQRRGLGIALVLAGVLTTIPAILAVRRGLEAPAEKEA